MHSRILSFFRYQHGTTWDKLIITSFYLKQKPGQFLCYIYRGVLRRNVFHIFYSGRKAVPVTLCNIGMTVRRQVEVYSVQMLETE